jgi:cell division septum initiation protein DivIVA
MMKQLKKDLKTVAKDLKRLTQKADKMIKQLEKLDKAQAAKKPKAKAVRKTTAKKPTRVSASETVLAIIKRSRKGVDKATLIKKTGFEDKKIRDTTYRLRKQRKIKRDRKGLYVKA